MRRALTSAVATIVLLVAGGACTCTSTPATTTDAGDKVTSDDAGTASGPDGSIVMNATDAGPVISCMARSCADVPANCGPVADGCGNVLQCGGCDAGTCGGGGTPSTCGAGAICIPRTCLAEGANCGTIGDGCGGSVDCGTCGTGSVCGGGGEPSVCSGSHVNPCTGLCQQQPSCPTGMTTTITGTVYAPTPPSAAGVTPVIKPDPLYNAFVYIPNGPLSDFTPSVACETCGAPVSGAPLITTTTAANGTFTLSNVPAGSNIPLVIQLGRWRRYVEIPTVTPCAPNALTDPEMTRLPRSQQETSQWDNIPLIAMVTGKVDPLECVLRKIGIADSEFTTPTGTVTGSSPARAGRIQIYVNNGSSLPNAPAVDSLIDTPATLANYDLVMFACDGEPPGGILGFGGWTPTVAEQNNVIAYSNAGGRVFATHFSYGFLYNIAPWEGTATWSPNGIPAGALGSVTAVVNQQFTDGINFAKWLLDVGASTTLGTFELSQTRNDFTAVTASEAELWVSLTSGEPMDYTFNTPVGTPTAMQCGRVFFSDFHVNPTGDFSGGGTFPSECDTSPMDAQEKALEFSLFDLSNCVQTGGVIAH